MAATLFMTQPRAVADLMADVTQGAFAKRPQTGE
jgi:hypothetical protein